MYGSRLGRACILRDRMSSSVAVDIWDDGESRWLCLWRSLIDRSVQRVGWNEIALHGISLNSHNRRRLRPKVETVLAYTGTVRSNNRLPM